MTLVLVVASVLCWPEPSVSHMENIAPSLYRVLVIIQDNLVYVINLKREMT